jgi:hypothetical protein
MADESFDHAAKVRVVLRLIVSFPAYGVAALSDAGSLSAALSWLLADSPRERSALVTAAEAGVADMIRRRVSAGLDASAAVKLSAESLAVLSPLPLPLDTWYWVAAEMALALGLITAEQADAIGSRRDAAKPDGARSSDPSAGPAGAPVASPGHGGYPAGLSEPYGPQPGWQPQGWSATGAYGPGPKPKPKKKKDPVSRAVRAVVRPGLLAFNPPSEMIQGRSERVEVGVARTPELREALTTGLRGRGVPEVVGVDTSPFMGVELRGSAFEIASFSPAEQLVAPMARWEFDVTPVRAGRQTLTLCVTLRVDSPVTPGGRIAVPVLEKKIRIRVDVNYGMRRFVTNNWQWLIATILGLGGALAAWLALFH